MSIRVVPAREVWQHGTLLFWSMNGVWLRVCDVHEDGIVGKRICTYFTVILLEKNVRAIATKKRFRWTTIQLRSFKWFSSIPDTHLPVSFETKIFDFERSIALPIVWQEFWVAVHRVSFSCATSRSEVGKNDYLPLCPPAFVWCGHRAIC